MSSKKSFWVLLIALTGFAGQAWAGDIFVCTRGSQGATSANKRAGFYFDVAAPGPTSQRTIRFGGPLRFVTNTQHVVGELTLASGSRSGIVSMRMTFTRNDGTAQTIARTSDPLFLDPYLLLSNTDGDFSFDVIGKELYVCTETFASSIVADVHEHLQVL